MTERRELEQRVFIGDVLDGEETLQEIKVTIDEVVWSDGHVEHQNEDFELNGEFVTYTELTGLYGKAKIDAFIEDAIQNAR